MPHFLITIIALIIFSLFSSAVFAQDAAAAAGQKTQELITALAKTKHKKKEKKGIRSESYVDIKSEPVVKSDVRQYAGVYESAPNEYRLELRVAGDGRVEGSGYDSGFMRNSRRESFTLEGARIEGALLTATKVFADGRKEKFEALFNNQTRVEGRNPGEINSRETRYGLGFIEAYRDSTTRVFLEFKN